MAKGKRCLKCEKWRPLERYSPMKKGRLGLHPYCKPCRSKENGPKFLIWREKNLEYHRAYLRKYKARMRGTSGRS
jgi:hypothetical protein